MFGLFVVNRQIAQKVIEADQPVAETEMSLIEESGYSDQNVSILLLHEIGESGIDSMIIQAMTQPVNI